MDKSSYKNGEPLDNSDYFVKWQIAKLCSVDIMPHQLYILLVSKTFLFFIRASKHAISILLILSKKKNLTNCVLSGTDEVDRGDKKNQRRNH